MLLLSYFLSQFNMSQQQQYRVPLVVLLLLLLVVMVTAKQQHYKPSTPPKNVYQYTPQSCSNSNMNYCAPGIHGAGGCYNPGYKYCQQGVMCEYVCVFFNYFIVKREHVCVRRALLLAHEPPL